MSEIQEYFYRGLIERPTKGTRIWYYWCAGYSTEGPHGTDSPWRTKKECREDAKLENKKAIFCENRDKKYA